MEFSGSCSKEEAEKKVEEMVRAAFQQRNVPLVKVMTKAVEHAFRRTAARLLQ